MARSSSVPFVATATAIAFIFLAIGMASLLVQARHPNLKIGNYWNYAFFEEDEEGLFVSGEVGLEIVGVEDRFINGTSAQVFLISISSSGEMYGSYNGTPVGGTITSWGTVERRISDFSLYRFSQTMWTNMTVFGITIPSSVGIECFYSPSQDDFVGTHTLPVGGVVVSHSRMQGQVWINILGQTSWESILNDTSTRMSILRKNVSIHTNAGTYDCDEVNLTTTVGDDSTYMTAYYSEEVGNYVKTEGGDFLGGMYGDMTLTSFFYSSDNTPPVAEAGSDKTVKPGAEVVFNGSASTDNIGITNYTWTFNTTTLDGSGESHILYGPVANFTFDDEGTYVVNLTVSDAGRNVAKDNITLTVKKPGGIAALLQGANLLVIAAVLGAIAALIVAMVIVGRRRKPASQPPHFVGSVQPLGPELPPPPPPPAS
jgi:PKD repeat protein